MPSTVTNAFKQAIRDHVAGNDDVPLKPVEAGFGDGGVDPAGHVRSAEPTRTALRSEIHRNTNVLVARVADTAIILISVHGDDTGPATISEIGVFNADAQLIFYATFNPRSIGPGVQLDFRLRI